MADKKLSYFMRPELMEEKIIEIPGPATILDENGRPVVFRIKKLSQEHITKIYDNYKEVTIAMDKKKNQPYVFDGKVVLQETKNNQKAYRHVIADALEYPNLRDSELMKCFGCVDVTDMPLKMFTTAEYDYVAKIVNHALGISTGDSTDEKDEDLETAKK